MNSIHRFAWLSVALLMSIGILSVYVFVTSVQEKIAAKPLVVTLDLGEPQPSVNSGQSKALTPDPAWSASLKESFAAVHDLSSAASTTGYELADGRAVFFQTWQSYDEMQNTFIAWLVDNGSAQILKAGSADVCSGYAYGTTTDGFYIERMDSPCEAGASFRTDYYNDDGNIVGTLSYAYPSTSFGFDEAGGSSLTVSLVYRDERCSAFNRETEYGFLTEIPAGEKLPTAKLTGLLVNGKTINLPRVRTVDCGEVYGGGADVPSIGDVEYLGDGVSVGLPGGGKAFISLQKGNAVSFEE
ncbi:MAG: hypothetical protein RDU25_01765 [Patescibacteria group bacterium]|nr:hypothetical protein [Patescibacteria group bacterium]